VGCPSGCWRFTEEWFTVKREVVDMKLRKTITGVGFALAGLVAVAGILYLTNSPPAVPPVPASEMAAPSKPFVVKLHARWCPVCMQTKDEWSDIARAYGDRVNLFVFDSTNETTIATSQRQAAALGLDRLLEDYHGASGAVLVINANTRQVETSVAGNHSFDSYRAAIDAALADRQVRD
jgi:thiol-disulfide isomerase/thioredoxin